MRSQAPTASSQTLRRRSRGDRRSTCADARSIGLLTLALALHPWRILRLRFGRDPGLRRGDVAEPGEYSRAAPRGVRKARQSTVRRRRLPPRLNSCSTTRSGEDASRVAVASASDLRATGPRLAESGRKPGVRRGEPIANRRRRHARNRSINQGVHRPSPSALRFAARANPLCEAHSAGKARTRAKPTVGASRGLSSMESKIAAAAIYVF